MTFHFPVYLSATFSANLGKDQQETQATNTFPSCLFLTKHKNTKVSMNTNTTEGRGNMSNEENESTKGIVWV